MRGHKNERRNGGDEYEEKKEEKETTNEKMNYDVLKGHFFHLMQDCVEDLGHVLLNSRDVTWFKKDCERKRVFDKRLRRHKRQERKHYKYKVKWTKDRLCLCLKIPCVKKEEVGKGKKNGEKTYGKIITETKEQIESFRHSVYQRHF